MSLRILVKIYVINLKRSTDRRQRVIDNLGNLKVPFAFFDAIDGRSTLPDDLEPLLDHNHRKWFRSRPLSPGERGVYASHFRLWQKCVELNEPIIVMEDDFLPTEFFTSALAIVPSLIDNRYEYLRLEAQDRGFSPIESDGSYQTVLWHDNSKGARAYAISPSGAKKLIDGNRRWLCAVDNQIGESYRTKLVCAGLLPYAVYNPADFETTIQIGGKTKVKVVFKLTRELYRFYRFIRQVIWNQIGLRQLKKSKTHDF